MGIATTQIDTNGFSSNARKVLAVNTSGYPSPKSEEPYNVVDYTATYSGAQTATSLISAISTRRSLFITDIIFANGATAGTFSLVDDTTSPTTILGPIYLAINRNISINLVTPLRISVNKDLGFTSTSATSHSVTVIGYYSNYDGDNTTTTTTSTTSSTSTSSSTLSTSSSTSSSSTTTVAP